MRRVNHINGTIFAIHVGLHWMQLVLNLWIMLTRCLDVTVGQAIIVRRVLSRLRARSRWQLGEFTSTCLNIVFLWPRCVTVLHL